VHGSLVLATDGSFVYTPDPDFFGTDSFAYQAWDITPRPIRTRERPFVFGSNLLPGEHSDRQLGRRGGPRGVSGGHLVAINDAPEQAFVYGTFAPVMGFSGAAAIGANDVATEGRSSEQRRRRDLTNWAAGEPNDFGGVEDFSGIQWASGEWNDVSVGDFGAVIEIPNHVDLATVTITVNPVNDAPVAVGDSRRRMRTRP